MTTALIRPFGRTTAMVATTERQRKRLFGDILIGNKSVTPQQWRWRFDQRNRRLETVPTRAMSAVDVEPNFDVLKKALEISGSLRGTSIFLVGINGSMKDEVGKIIADALRYCYLDSDSLVVQAAGGILEARALLQNDEQGFCDSETEVLKQLSSMGRLVVNAGDGSVQNATNLSYLRYGVSVWIDVPLDILAEEKHKNSDEYPLLKAQPANSYPEMLKEIIRCYEESQEGYSTADARVSLQELALQIGRDVEDLTPDDVALEALNKIEKMMRVKKMMEDAGRPF